MLFEAMDLYEHWMWSPIQWTLPISRKISNEL